MFSKVLFVFVIFSISVINKANGKIYTNCELARELQRNGIPRHQIADWVCLAVHESNLNTQAINHSSGDYGIFQISRIYWCNDGHSPGKGCHITCDSLLGDDITLDINCAKRIFEVTARERGCGFSAWVAYNQHCRGRDNEHYIRNCNLGGGSRHEF